MPKTKSTNYRLEPEYREALRRLAVEMHREGRLTYASEANAIRALTAEAAEKTFGKFPLPS